MGDLPRLLEHVNKIIERLCEPRLVEGIQGDLEEAFFKNSGSKGRFLAKWIYIFQAVGFLRPRFRKRSKS